MLVELNKVVSFHYRLRDAENELIEDSHEDNSPVVYLHGHNGIIQGLENALVGKAAGDKFNVTLAPEQGYGPRKADSIQRVSINHIVGGAKKKSRFKPGVVVHLNTKNGPVPAIIVKAGLKTLDVDTNHPLAGKTLAFEIEVLDVREASTEELEHGHVHGDGGHHH